MRRLLLVLFLLAGAATVAKAQNGLYVPAAIPQHPANPMGTYGMYIARDSVFYLDSIVVRQVAPSPTYDSIWVATERCSKMPLADSVRASWTISAAPGDGFIPHGGKDPVPGYTFVEHRNIVVLEKYVVNKALLGHEMIHALLWEHGIHNIDAHHRRPEFAACGLQGQ